MKRVEFLYLNIDKWNCGQGQLGKGYSKLLNEEGYYCCLGQFLSQVGIRDEEILNRNVPYSFSKGAYLFVKPNGLLTPLGTQIIDVNDNPDTSLEYKIRIIRKLCWSEHIKLRVI